MKKIGIADAFVDDKGYVYGTIPATKGKEDKPVIGFIAHMDTAEDASGDNIKAKVVEYNGGDVLLNEEKQIVLSEKEYPDLKKICRPAPDGHPTAPPLLGADDKAGVAEIMTMAEQLMSHPEIEHGHHQDRLYPRTRRSAGGANYFDVEGFGRKLCLHRRRAGELGELEYENFNAGAAKVVIHGLSIHTGSAKDAMVNASLLAMEFHQMLPVEQNPRYTTGYEGFFHLGHIEGEVELAEMDYIIRDHDAEKYAQKEQVMRDIAAYMNHKYGEGTVELTITESYPQHEGED